MSSSRGASWTGMTVAGAIADVRSGGGTALVAKLSADQVVTPDTVVTGWMMRSVEPLVIYLFTSSPAETRQRVTGE